MLLQLWLKHVNGKQQFEEMGKKQTSSQMSFKMKALCFAYRNPGPGQKKMKLKVVLLDLDSASLFQEPWDHDVFVVV